MSTPRARTITLAFAVLLATACDSGDGASRDLGTAVTPAPSGGSAGASDAGASGASGGSGPASSAGGTPGAAGAQANGGADAGGSAGAAASGGAPPATGCAAADIKGPCAELPSGSPGCCALGGTLYDLSLGCFRPAHFLACSSSCGSLGDLSSCFEVDRGDGHIDLFTTPGFRHGTPDLEAQGIREVGCTGAYAAYPPCP